MNKLITTLLLLMVVSAFNTINAQRLIGVKGAFIHGGYTTNNALNIEAGFEKFFGLNNSNSFNFSVNYSSRKADFNKLEQDIKLTDITVNAGARKYFNNFGYFLPYIGADLFCGYGIINKNDISDTMLLSRDNSILYGVRSSIGGEYLFDVFSVYINVSPQYELKYKEFSTSFNLGLKYFF